MIPSIDDDPRAVGNASYRVTAGFNSAELFNRRAMMAKKAANAEFNMAEAIRDILTANPKLTSKEVSDAIMEKFPSAKINKNSFSVAFYTGRKKLGMGAKSRGRRFAKRVGRTAARSAGTRPSVNLATLQHAAKFLSEVGGAEAAIEAIRQVQAVQIK